MPLLKPDPTFYPSPKMAMQSAPEKLAYVALINPTKSGTADAIGVVDVDPDSKSYGRWSVRPTCRRRATSCITSAGTRAARVSVPTRRTRTWSGAT